MWFGGPHGQDVSSYLEEGWGISRTEVNSGGMCAIDTELVPAHDSTRCSDAAPLISWGAPQCEALRVSGHALRAAL
eukprot:6589016-Alexandrium_andersonii.AAC.1